MMPGCGLGWDGLGSSGLVGWLPLLPAAGGAALYNVHTCYCTDGG
jgi:hypothetical protein